MRLSICKTVASRRSLRYAGLCTLIIVVAVGCSGKRYNPIGDYRYTCYDDKGNVVAGGRISITSSEVGRVGSEEQTQFKGDWELIKVDEQARAGMQEGKGELTGSLNKGEIKVNLNPNTSAAVILRGEIEDKGFHGTWSCDCYVGPVVTGKFEAVKR
jgi:hypothetical protein